jgi:hypothetical protein
MHTQSTFRLLTAGLLSMVSLTPVFASQKPPSPQARVTAPLRAPSSRNVFVVGVPPRTLASGIPELAATDVSPAESVKRFIDRASIARVNEREAIRTVILRARANEAISRALAVSVFQTRTQDFTRTLTSLAVLGELQNSTSEAALTTFVRMPLPTQGHLIEGEIAERMTMEQLQMKAVQGIAYAKTSSGDAEVLRVVREHPSRAVRAEAIEAYLYNHGYSGAARATLLTVVHPDERISLDRPHLLPATAREDFNAQLVRYLTLHPELRPPATQSRHLVNAAIERQKEAAAAVRRRLAPPPQR